MLLRVNLDACLPVELRGSSTIITRVAAGLSSAGVYRVDAAGNAYVLKISDGPVARWRRTLHIQQLAAEAHLAPRIIHADEDRRAILSIFVTDLSFPAFYRDPATHVRAIDQLGRMVRRLHELPLSDEADVAEPTKYLQTAWSEIEDVQLPSFVREAVQRVLTDDGPPSERVVLSHNDVNPSNLLYDGTELLLLDWDAAGPNDMYYDLGTIAVFLRMDEPACLALLSAYHGRSALVLPPGFVYDRRLAAVICGATFLRLAHFNGHPGMTHEETIDTAPSMGECYQGLRSGALDMAAAEGQWSFGLALVKAGVMG